MKTLYCVVMIHSNLVVHVSSDPVSTNYLTAGLLNTTVKVIDYDSWNHDCFRKISDRLTNFLNNDMDEYFKYVGHTITRQGHFQFCTDEVSAEFKKCFSLARIRFPFIVKFLQYFQHHLNRTKEYDCGSINEIIMFELLKCNPPNFSMGIVEYANINNISADTAYQELSMLISSANIVKIRNKALFDKYIIKINTIENIADGEQLFKDAINDLWRKAAV